jgi:hypothetical protein
VAGRAQRAPASEVLSPKLKSNILHADGQAALEQVGSVETHRFRRVARLGSVRVAPLGGSSHVHSVLGPVPAASSTPLYSSRHQATIRLDRTMPASVGANAPELVPPRSCRRHFGSMPASARARVQTNRCAPAAPARRPTRTCSELRQRAARRLPGSPRWSPGRGNDSADPGASARRADLLNVHARDGAGHDQPLNLAGALEDRVAPFSPSAEIHRVRRDAAWSARLSIAFSDVAVSFSAL